MGRITVRFTDYEEKTLKEEAKKYGTTCAELIRKRMFSGATEDNFLEYRMDLKNGLEYMLKAIDKVLVQARMGNRLNGEILYKLSPTDAVWIVQEVKRKYLNEQKEG